MGYLFCVMGKSSSGKDSIYQKLIVQESLQLNQIVPYTTRPMREGEISGESYFFCTEEQVSGMERDNRIIELRAYHTVHGIWKYFTADDGQIQLEKGNYILIGTLETYEKIRAFFGADHVIPIYIEVEDTERLQRALDREKKQRIPKLEEMCRRFLADQVDFSEEKIQKAGIRHRFNNKNLDDTIGEISTYIKEIETCRDFPK